jgi:site-specific DNA-methyltransferase (adenine-specific)
LDRPPFTLDYDDRCATIYMSDCIRGMPEALAPGAIDVVVTSPPYNLGTSYRAYDDTIPRTDYLDWLEAWAAATASVLHDDGSVFLNIGAKPSDPTVPFQVLERMQRHFTLQNVIHWIKSIAIQKADVGNYPGISGNVGVGHFKPINSPRFLNDCHEYIFHLTKHGRVALDRLAIGVEYQDKSNVARWKSAGGDRRCRGNTWFVPYRTIRSRAKQRPHPASFPARIPEMCIRLHGLDRTRRVLDPFLGIGNSAVACVQLGVDFVGFEIDPEYFDESCRALQTAAVSHGQTKEARTEA